MSKVVGGGSRAISLTWLQGLLCGVLAALAPALALLLGVLLAPAALAAMVDRMPGKPRARAAFLFGLSACVGPVHWFWGQGAGMGDAGVILADGQALALAWVATGGGWLVAEGLPFALRTGMELAHRARAARLAAERDRLKEEWG